jgi:hypothetical protein
MMVCCAVKLFSLPLLLLCVVIIYYIYVSLVTYIVILLPVDVVVKEVLPFLFLLSSSPLFYCYCNLHYCCCILLFLQNYHDGCYSLLRFVSYFYYYFHHYDALLAAAQHCLP